MLMLEAIRDVMEKVWRNESFEAESDEIDLSLPE
jgi:hypothetical protein